MTNNVKYNNYINGSDKWTIEDGIITFYINGFPIHDLIYNGLPPTNEKLNYIYEKITS